MKVSELIKKLSKFDANADVYINDIYDLIVETDTEYCVIESENRITFIQEVNKTCVRV